MRKITGILLVLSALLITQTTNAQRKDSTITAIYTDFKNYWTTSTKTNNVLYPDTSHNLLAFTFRGKTYSTGVNDNVLTTKLGSNNYSAQVYKSLPVSNIAGKTIGNDNTLTFALKDDGDSTKAAYHSPYPIIHIADVLTDGKNGLDLGTGVTNLPKGAHISFPVKNLSIKTATDSIPDFVFTQIAQPTTNLPDTIFFFDANHNVVGNKKLVYWNSVSKLGTYRLDLYSLTPNMPCNTSIMNGLYEQNGTRDIRMVAFLITEFGITDTTTAAQVKGLQINPCGSSDQAFIAYNTNIIHFDVPIILTQPATQVVCSTTTSSSVTFSVNAFSTSDMTYQWKKNGADIVGATSSSYTATGLTLADTANAYSVKVTNSVGAITSDNAYVKYVILSQPSSLYLAVGSTATFTVGTSGATGYQWQKGNAKIKDANADTYSKTNLALSDAGSYAAVVSYNGGTCNSNAATLTVENLPIITKQPATQTFCSNATTSATFSVTAAPSVSNLTYQWYKNGTAISGANASSLNLTNLTLADTANSYYVILTNGIGSKTSNSVSVKYIILNQPSSLYLGVGATATFNVVASGATSYQWKKANANISGATAATYSKTNIALTDASTYTATVNYDGGNCTSNPATLTIEGLPSIKQQPVAQILCNPSTNTTTFSVSASTTISSLKYQWYKNKLPITGAVSASYSPTGLTLADTANVYYVAVSNAIGTINSNNASFKYLIISEPASQLIATGNTVSFSVKASMGITAYQWQKNGASIPSATQSTYTFPGVNYDDAGKYTVKTLYGGSTNTCISDTAVLKTSIILYSKASGNFNQPSTWGVATDGSGSSPVDFTRSEHTFVLSNRSAISTGASITIAGKLDVANSTLTITPGTTLTAGRVIRSLSTGVIAGSSSSNLSLTGISTAAYSGSSDLYFDAVNDTLHNLTIAGHSATLHTALNITGGKTPGRVQINSGGTLATSDSLTLKSDINGTASIASSAGTITGKVTIEKFIHARRAWRLMSAPITSAGAPSINAAWQEGAVSSTDNPHPGFGTHITYGAVADGFDQNPQKTFSMRVYNSNTSSWVGVPATKTTAITAYPAYLIFIRGNRSYNILTTTNYVTPMTTILRATGNVKQGTLAAQTVAASGFTLTANPYASPINFTKLISLSQNIKARYRVWDPSLAGDKGTGAWVTVDGSTGTYKSIPPSAYVANTLEAGQGFFVQSSDGKNAGSVLFAESVKDSTLSTTSADRMGDTITPDTSLEINLKLFNPDSTTAIADGVLFNFSSSYSDSVDNDDAVKMGNTGENLGIQVGASLLTIDDRTMPKKDDSLQLSFTNAKSANYQFEIVPSSLSGESLALYDRYLKTLSPLSSSDTTYIPFTINTSIAASKASNRFVVVVINSRINNTVLPVELIGIKAVVKAKAAQVSWTVANEGSTVYYEVEKSTDGANFIAAGSVMATGASSYLFTDNTPVAGINYYRVKSVSKTGAILYSGVVTARLQSASSTSTDGASSVSVYPNPLVGTTFTLTLTNKPAGSYTLSVVDESGTIQLTKQIVHNGGMASQQIALNKKLIAGIYYIKIVSSTGASDILKVEAQ